MMINISRLLTAFQRLLGKSEKNVSRRTRHVRNTAAIIALSFVIVIAIGTIMLSLPVCRIDGISKPIDAAFTSTSAVCVTGLTASDTGLTYSFLGQLVILILVQIGGLGYMTLAVAMAVLMGKRLGVASAVHIMQSNGETHLAGMSYLAKNTVLYTFSIEGVGALLYFVKFSIVPEIGFSFKALWYAVFHSVMSFCNAGFDLMGPLYGSNSGLSHFGGDIFYCFTLSFLVFFGSLGYAVFADLVKPVGGGDSHWRHMLMSVFSLKNRHKHSTHTIIAVNTTIILIAIGAVVILLTEYKTGFAGMVWWRKLLMSVFESITCRTAGFTTLSFSSMSNIGLHLLCPLMFIGGCPVSTAGGIKTTTIAVIYAALRSALTGKPDVEICSRRVPQKYLNRAIAVTMIGIAVVIAATVLLCYTESSSISRDLSRLQFEVISAVGTVGLSTGLAAEMSAVGKMILMVAMFIGRIGSITFFNMLVYSDKKIMRRLAEDDIVIG